MGRRRDDLREGEGTNLFIHYPNIHGLLGGGTPFKPTLHFGYLVQQQAEGVFIIFTRYNIHNNVLDRISTQCIP